MPPSDPPPKLTPEDIVDWLTPPQAVTILVAVLKDPGLAKHALLERLRGGAVRAVADHSAFEGASIGEWRERLHELSSGDWKRVDTGDTFWIIGDLTLNYRPYGQSGSLTERHFDVRFEPQAVHAIVWSVRQTSAAEQPSLAHVEPEPKGPRVSEAHLKAWFEFYKKIGGEMREEPASASARMNFPNNSIPRKMIRDLLGSRPMGRPKSCGT